jgi:hypothetical protein
MLPASTFCVAGEGNAPPLFPVNVKGKWGYIDQTGQMVIPPQFGFACRFSEGLATVVTVDGENEKHGFIDRTRTIVVP